MSKLLILVAITVTLLLGTSREYAKAVDLNDVTITKTDGTTISGSIETIDQQGEIAGPGLPENLTVAEVLSIETEKEANQPPVPSVSIVLTSGSQIVVREPHIKIDTVRFESAFGVDRIPLQAVRAIVWKSSPNIQTRIQSPSSDKDVVFVQTDDGERNVGGIIERLDTEHLKINFRNESRSIGLEKLKAIVMADVGLAAPEGARASVRLTDGSAVDGVIENLANGKLKLKLTESTSVVFETRYIASIAVRSDRLQYLSDLEPIDVEQQTHFTIERPWQRDRSIEGNRITLPGERSGEVITFGKGLGTQAYTQLVYQNTNDFDRLMATVGIDTETHGRGDCQLIVRGDGIELWSGRVRGTDPPIQLDLNISGLKRIALVVNPGENFDLADHADWGNARFVKTK